jgi:hypothetical protein
VCGEPIDDDGGYRRTRTARDGDVVEIGMTPFCAKHLAEFDAKAESES